MGFAEFSGSLNYFLSSRSKYWPYWFLAMGLAKSANCSLESQPLRQAISSRQAT